MLVKYVELKTNTLLLSILMQLFDIKAFCESWKTGGRKEPKKPPRCRISWSRVQSLTFLQKSFPCFYNNKPPCGSGVFIHYLALNPTKACASVRSFVEDFIFVEEKGSKMSFFSLFLANEWRMLIHCYICMSGFLTPSVGNKSPSRCRQI